MTVAIGTIGTSPGWEELLRQEGVPFHRVTVDETPAQTFSAIVVCRTPQKDETEFLTGFLRSGGALFGCSAFLRDIAPAAEDFQHISYLTPDAGKGIGGLSLMDVEMIGSIPREANCLRTTDNVYAVFVGELLGGLAVVMPFDPGMGFEDYRAAERYFYARPERLPSERVSRVAKGEILHFVHAVLEHLHHARGLAYAHLSPFPGGAQSVFALRIDTDGASKGEIDELYGLSRSEKVPFTWFVDVGSHESWLSVFQQMEQQEIGLHCYTHRVYLDASLDAQNIDRGIRVLRESGISPRCFAAPYGFWSPDLGRTIDSAGFRYSSEFAWAYDTLPHFPVTSQQRYATLQIPVHPVSIGSLRRAGYTALQMTQYYHDVFSRKIARHESLVFYHHPGHREWRVIRRLCEEARGVGARVMTLGEYAAWWNVRLGIRPTVSCGGGSLVSKCEGPSPLPVDLDVLLEISRRPGEKALIALGSSVALDEISWRSIPLFSAPSDISRMREFDLRGEIGRQFTRLQRRFP